ncbi:MAG: DUF4349 domain-containing protein, partial [Anaerolineaceae bacterium]|nr:DUF4349 domain-containing protein [Anaerolineaceae bacterium]
MPRSKSLWALAVAVALLLSAIFFAGCARSQSGAIPPEEAPREDNAAGDDFVDESPADGGDTLPILDPGTVDPSKKIIYTVDMALEVEDAAKALNDIIAATEELGGYMADSRYYAYRHDIDSYVTVRIPPEKLKEFTGRVSTLGKVMSQSMDSEDVTDQYTDLTARLANAQAQEAQLLEIMKQAKNIEDILLVREQLNTVQAEIEILKGKIRQMDNQVGYSTVTIRLTEPAPPVVTPDEEGVKFWGFGLIGQRIGRGFV